MTLVYHVYEFQLGLFVYLSVSGECSTAVHMSREGTDKQRIFRLLVEIADERTPCHVA